MLPPPSARAIQGHPLCPNAAWIFNGAIVEIISGLRGTPASDTTFVPWSIKGYGGLALSRAATSTTDILGLEALFLPGSSGKGDGSIVTLVQALTVPSETDKWALAANYASGSGHDCAISLNDTDGSSFYWQWASTTSRLVIANSAFAYPAEGAVYAMTNGPRGKEVWENGVRKGNNTGFQTTRSASTGNLVLGHNSLNVGDYAYKVVFTYVYWRELSPHDISLISLFPFCWVDPRS